MQWVVVLEYGRLMLSPHLGYARGNTVDGVADDACWQVALDRSKIAGKRTGGCADAETKKQGQRLLR